MQSFLNGEGNPNIIIGGKVVNSAQNTPARRNASIFAAEISQLDKIEPTVDRKNFIDSIGTTDRKIDEKSKINLN